MSAKLRALSKSPKILQDLSHTLILFKSESNKSVHRKTPVQKAAAALAAVFQIPGLGTDIRKVIKPPSWHGWRGGGGVGGGGGGRGGWRKG